MGVRRRRRRHDTKDDENDDNDDDIPEKKYDEFTASLRSLDGKKKLQPPTRAEPSFQVSEFHLSKPSEGSLQQAKENVNVQDLAQLIAKKPHLALFHQQFQETQRKSKKLPKPLEQTVEKKIKRKVGYGHIKKDLDKWSSVVESNRVADQIKFPLEKREVEIYDNCDILSTFSNATPLEEAMAVVLQKSEVAQKENKKEEEKRKKYNLTLKEMMERRKMMAKVRAQESFLAVKAKYQKKIKSKKYHRILRKDKIKQQMKDFENLKNTDPDAALEQLNQIEKVRAQERATLRHRNTGRWAKNMAVRAKFDKESRQVLAEQIAQSRALTQKMQTNSSDESDGEDPELEDNVDNPWINKKPENEIDQFFSGYRKYWTDKNKDIIEIDVNKTSKVKHVDNSDKSEVIVSDSTKKSKNSIAKKGQEHEDKKKKSNIWVVTPVANLGVETVKDGKKISKPQDSSKSSSQNQNKKIKSFKANLDDFDKSSSASKLVKPNKSSAIASIDPDNIIKVQAKVLKSGVARNFSAGDIMDEDEDTEITEDPHLTIAEAFADDDVVNEFRVEKENENKKSVITEEEVGMPGWGHWAGFDLQPNQNLRKKRRRIMKLPKPPPRLDHNKGRAIIFEEESQSVQQHQVDAIPFPFKSVQDYESSVRMPVGKTWVSTTANRKLTAPPIITKLGTIIEPMDSSQLLKNDTLKLNK